MKLGGEIKTRRLSVRDEYKFVNARARSPARDARVLREPTLNDVLLIRELPFAHLLPS
jgi:hypothetical protein